MGLKRLKFILKVFGGIVIAGIIGYMLLEGLSFWDAAYLTIVTVCTVGYGDIVPTTVAGRAFTMFLVVAGVSMTYYIVTLLVALTVEGQLQNILGRRGMHRKIASLQGHIIVCGAGRVGSNVVERLRHEKEEFLVVENNETIINRLMENRALVVQGDATRDEVLLEAGIKSAKGIITTLSHDADNVYVALTAKSLNPAITIVARAERPEAEEKLRRAGANTVIFPSVMGGGRWFRP